MKYKNLGNSGLLVSDLCLGTMIFGEDSQRSTSPKDAEKIIHKYLDEGGNHIDTADVYADGRSEEIIGQALKNKRQDVVLATKVRFTSGDGPNDTGLSRSHIMSGVEKSLKRLDIDYIDLYYMHCWDPITPIKESLRAFDDLVTAGKVRYIGVSNFKAWQLMKSLSLSDDNGWARFVAGQYQYSLVNRDIEYEFMDLFEEEGIGLTPWGPLGGGFLSGKYERDKKPKDTENYRIASSPSEVAEAWERRNIDRNWVIVDAVSTVAKERSATHSQISLAWLRAQPTVSSVIMGVRTMAQLKDNLAAAEIDLTDEELIILNQASAMPELYPYHFIDQYGSRD